MRRVWQTKRGDGRSPAATHRRWAGRPRRGGCWGRRSRPCTIRRACRSCPLPRRLCFARPPPSGAPRALVTWWSSRARSPRLPSPCAAPPRYQTTRPLAALRCPRRCKSRSWPRPSTQKPANGRWACRACASRRTLRWPTRAGGRGACGAGRTAGCCAGHRAGWRPPPGRAACCTSGSQSTSTATRSRTDSSRASRSRCCMSGTPAPGTGARARPTWSTPSWSESTPGSERATS
mmetsp:Transcript_26372/g.85178  ORF Transcript_26372/g.85178 Transcript_26372/m.85178 type:complete len:234 (-) Transcript_26372:116-817(-)